MLARQKNNLLNYINEIKKSSGTVSISNLIHYIPYFFRWHRYLNNVEHVFVNDMPWFNFEAVDYLDRLLERDMRVFEYSSGGSTLYFSKRVKQVYSIEHNKDWYENVFKNINVSNVSNCTIRLIEPEATDNYPERDYKRFDSYVSTDALYREQTFTAYAQSIDDFQDDYFDVVLIDGRARPSCYAHAHGKVKIGGYLILDNSEREEYKHIHKSLDNKNWEKKEFFGPGPYVMNFWGTTFWKRIAWQNY